MQDVTGQDRTLKLALEARIGVMIHETSAAMDWVIEHAVYVLTRFSIVHDGVTLYERLTGRKWVRSMVEIDEVVLAKVALPKLG